MRADGGGEDVRPDLSIVILTWNRVRDVGETLDRIAAIPHDLTLQIIVVDNGSTDGTAQTLRSTYPYVELVALDRNVGTSGWNAGFARARAEWILSLDDDSAPEGAWLRELPARLRDRADTGIVACRVLKGDDRKLVTAGWGSETTDFIACGALIRRAALDEVGMYDPSIFLYSHEKELALRVVAAGYRIQYEPDFLVYHRASSAHRSSERYLRLGIQDVTYRIFRYYPLHLTPFAVAFMFAHHARWCRNNGDSIARHALLVTGSMWRGVRKGWTRRDPLSEDQLDRLARAWRADIGVSPRRRRIASLLPRRFFW